MTTEAPPALTRRNRVFRPAAETSARYRVIYGGAGSGKSVYTAQDYVALLTERKRRLLVIRKVKSTIRDSTFKLFCDILEAMGRMESVRANETSMSIRFPNGSEIIHAGLDKVKKLKSIAQPTDIWVEEATELDWPTSETEEPDLAQIDLRLRGVEDGTITITFNPTLAAVKIFDYLGVPTADLPCRDHRTYTVTTTLPDGEPFVSSVYVQHTTWEDNPWVGADYVAVFARLGGVMQAVYERGELVAVDAPDQLIKYEWVKAAFERQPEDAWTDGRRRLACDPARFGDDETVITEGEGDRMEYTEAAKGQDTTTTGHRIVSLCHERGVAAENATVDTVGLGSGTADTASSLGFKPVEFIGGASPVRSVPDLPGRPGLPDAITFNNLRSQAWWFLRVQMEAGTVSFSQALPDAVKRKLQEDLLAPRYRTGQEKRIEVEPKEGTSKAWGIKTRLGRSPDYGDAEVMRLFGEHVRSGPTLAFGLL